MIFDIKFYPVFKNLVMIPFLEIKLCPYIENETLFSQKKNLYRTILLLESRKHWKS